MPAASVNVFGIHQYDNQTSFFDPSTPVLPQSAGWAVIVGFGAFFAVFTLVLVWFDIKFAGHKIVSENFQTAGRAIKTGLISVDVVSHWTWSITLLQSSTVAYSWGIAGGTEISYLSGCTTDLACKNEPLYSTCTACTCRHACCAVHGCLHIYAI